MFGVQPKTIRYMKKNNNVIHTEAIKAIHGEWSHNDLDADISRPGFQRNRY